MTACHGDTKLQTLSSVLLGKDYTEKNGTSHKIQINQQQSIFKEYNPVKHGESNQKN